MELERAYETLGLEQGASAQEVETAYRQLCEDLDARLARASSPAVRERYAEARAELDPARSALLASLGQDPAPPEADPQARAWAVLGLRPSASMLEVATAFVSLRHEMERELASAPTEAIRQRCLEARAEVDAAYRLCALGSAGDEEDRALEASESVDSYETQMSAEPFEAPSELAEPAPSFQVDPDESSDARDLAARPAPQRRRRRFAQALAAVASASVLAVGGVAGYGWWTGIDVVQQVRRLIPSRPDPELVELQGEADYLRRRVGEEKLEFQARAERTRARVTRLEADLAAATTDEMREPISEELVQARERRSLAAYLTALTEQHVFSGNELAVAYGKIELGNELAHAAESRRAKAAYADAKRRLELSLERLDAAEEALGARSEALAAREAWSEFAAAEDGAIPPAADEGAVALARAEGRLARGEFADAVPELREASQQFRIALDDARRSLALARETDEEALRVAAAERAESERAAALAAAELAATERAAAQRARAAADARARRDDALSLAPVAAPPPVTPAERAVIKLVSIPGGEFFYGCDPARDLACTPDEAPGGSANLPAFRIDRTEVRVDEYALCVDAGRCREPATGDSCNWSRPERGEHPVNCIDWEQASTYCAWVGKRLPSEREWEKAARGTDGRVYPWGDAAPSCDQAVMVGNGADGCGVRSTWPVASLEAGRSPYGLFDMAGNVLEWTNSGGDDARVVRGGSWRSFSAPVRASSRERMDAMRRDGRVGFRCALGPATLADALR